ncbi:hypothetical protein R1sor_015032 [Riccia sorocarpa]|uniref:Uncharacterized protein n=1 Tax=Riccia sorocarpa TaxID=122646 RepID=A0ABD3HBD9_9MARC
MVRTRGAGASPSSSILPPAARARQSERERERGRGRGRGALPPTVPRRDTRSGGRDPPPHHSDPRSSDPPPRPSDPGPSDPPPRLLGSTSSDPPPRPSDPRPSDSPPPRSDPRSSDPPPRPSDPRPSDPPPPRSDPRSSDPPPHRSDPGPSDSPPRQTVREGIRPLFDGAEGERRDFSAEELERLIAGSIERVQASQPTSSSHGRLCMLRHPDLHLTISHLTTEEQYRLYTDIRSRFTRGEEFSEKELRDTVRQHFRDRKYGRLRKLKAMLRALDYDTDPDASLQKPAWISETSWAVMLPDAQQCFWQEEMDRTEFALVHTREDEAAGRRTLRTVSYLETR